MAQVIVTESSLQNIAGAIRSKLGTQDTYTPSEMAGAIAQIHGDPVLEELNTNANGTFTPSSGKDGFSRAIVNVANSYSSSDEGKVVSNGALVGQSSQGINVNGTYNTTLKNEVVVNVPNSYSASDEGKVVNNGALVAQSSQSITQNGTYDTTLKNQVTVNVSGGGSVLVPKTITQNGSYNPASDNADGYSQVTVNVSGGGEVIPDVPSAYQKVEYIIFNGANRQYVTIPSVSGNTQIKTKYRPSKYGEYSIIGGHRSGNATSNYDFETYVYNKATTARIWARNNAYYTFDALEMKAHTLVMGDTNDTEFDYVESLTVLNDYPNSSESDLKIKIGNYNPTNNSNYFYGRCYYVSLLNKTSGNYDYFFVPCYRKSDDVIGFYDTVNGAFYPNEGNGEFGKGADV